MGKKKPEIELQIGMIFEKTDCVYDKQMILSDKVMQTPDGMIRECVAWNSKQCRRYDTAESELKKSTLIAQISPEEVEQYILNNKSEEWGDPKPPKYKK